MIFTFLLFPETQIDVIWLSFIKIVGDILKTTSFDLHIFGSPKLIPGPAGGSAIDFNGINDYLMFGDQSGTF